MTIPSYLLEFSVLPGRSPRQCSKSIPRAKRFRKSTVTLSVMIVFSYFLLWLTGTSEARTQGFPNTLFPHIKTWGIYLTNSVTADETVWAASHFDILGGNLASTVTSEQLYQINPNAKYCAYENPPEWSDGSFATLEQWSAANGYAMEDNFVHYTEDVMDDVWHVAVPGYRAECSPDCAPAATATSPEQARVRGLDMARPDWRMRNLQNPQTYLYAIYEQSSIYGNWPRAHNPAFIFFDALSTFDYQLSLLHIDKTDAYAGATIDFNHPRMDELFQWGLDYVASVQSQYGFSMIPIANASATYYLNDAKFRDRFLTYYDWAAVEVWLEYKNADAGASLLSYEEDYEAAIAEITRQSLAGEKRLLRGNETYSEASDRGKIFLLGCYYLINNENTYFNYKKINDQPAGYEKPSNEWFGAIGYNIGIPMTNPAGQADFDGHLNTKEHFEWATGTDPASSDKTYHVLARRYSNALVLVKFRPKGSTLGIASATTHDLKGTYRPLNVDGTLGGPVTQVTLRNNEAAILIEVDNSAPGAVRDLSR